jgi:hypothetical protein
LAENIKDILDKLENKDELAYNPFSNVPNQQLEEALNLLEELSSELLPSFSSEAKRNRQ